MYVRGTSNSIIVQKDIKRTHKTVIDHGETGLETRKDECRHAPQVQSDKECLMGRQHPSVVLPIDISNGHISGVKPSQQFQQHAPAIIPLCLLSNYY